MGSNIKYIEMQSRLFEMCETYQSTPSKNGKGTFFFTDCGNTMYSVSLNWAFYHKKICPKCGKTLLMRGTSEGIDYADWYAMKHKSNLPIIKR